MKKILFSMSAMAKKAVVAGGTAGIVLLGSAFTQKSATGDVYFQLDASGNPILTIQPVSNPASLGCNGFNDFCAREYTSYQTVSPGHFQPGNAVASSTLLKD